MFFCNDMSKLSKKESQKAQTFISQQEKVIFGEASMPPQMAPHWLGRRHLHQYPLQREGLR
jgi:hypothetical protein